MNSEPQQQPITPAPEQTPTESGNSPTPKYFYWDRNLVGWLDVLKQVLQNSAIGSVGFGAGAHDWLLVAAGAVLGVLRVGVSYVVATSKIKNPL